MVTQSEVNLHRANIAREEFAKQYCPHWGPQHIALLPVTFDGKELLAAFEQIERLRAEEFAAYQAEQQNPWLPPEPRTQYIDWGHGSDRSSSAVNRKLMEIGLSRQRAVGMPAAYKHTHRDHPAVQEALAKARRTAEWVVHERRNELREQLHAASHAYVQAANAGVDAEEVRKLEAENDAALERYEAAEAECRRLAQNLSEALKIVRDHDGGGE